MRWPQVLCVVQDREELVQRRGVVKEAELFGPGTKARSLDVRVRQSRPTANRVSGACGKCGAACPRLDACSGWRFTYRGGAHAPATGRNDANRDPSLRAPMVVLLPRQKFNLTQRTETPEQTLSNTTRFAIRYLPSRGND